MEGHPARPGREHPLFSSFVAPPVKGAVTAGGSRRGSEEILEGQMSKQDFKVGDKVWRIFPDGDKIAGRIVAVTTKNGIGNILREPLYHVQLEPQGFAILHAYRLEKREE